MKSRVRSRLGLQLGLERELRLQVVVRARAQRLLDQPEGGRRAGGEPPRQLGRPALERVVVDDLPDQAPVGGRLGGDRLGQQAHAHGARLPDQARQPVGAARIRDQPDPRERLDETSPSARR